MQPYHLSTLKDFVIISVSALFRSEAAKNRLGLIWWVLEPFLMMLAFYVVFGLVLQRGGEGFVFDLLVGISVWTWFSASVDRGMMSIIRASRLIQQVYVPKYLPILVDLLFEFIKFIIVLTVLLILLATINSVYLQWLFLPLLISVQALFILGCGLVAGAMLPFLHDLKFVLTLCLRVGMFLSGVFFVVDERIPEPYRDCLMLNPMTVLITSYRNILIDGSSPHLSSLSAVAVLSIVLIFLGLALLRRFDCLYPRVLA